jgi:hypothetical protein
MHIRDLGKAPVERYVEVQRTRGKILTLKQVDVDIEQMIVRPFLCDRHRCIQWTPHEKKSQARPLIDNSCCSRYRVPVTDIDREKLAEVLPLVKKRLAANHPLNADVDAAPYEIEDDYQFVMQEHESGACQFVLYEKGRTTCAIHKTCLEEGLSVWDYKPLGCSLWPVALVDYEIEGKTRYLLTAYTRATAGLFEGEEDEGNDESVFACLVDQDPAYEPLYRTAEGVLTHLLGADFYKALDREAKKFLIST